MGVTLVNCWKATRAYPSMNDIQDRITILGGLTSSKWAIHFRLYKEPTTPLSSESTSSILSDSLDMYIANDTCQANTCYSIIPNKSIIESDRDLESILVNKLKHAYQLRQSAKIEGVEYTLGDMKIRIGFLSVGGNMKGQLFMEMEYVPVEKYEWAMGCLNELLVMVVTSTMASKIQAKKEDIIECELLAKKNEIFSRATTAAQYVHLLRKESLL